MYVQFNPFMTEAVYHIETSPLICSENQWTGFYMITAPVMKGLSRVSNGSTYYLKLYFRFNIIRFFMLKRYKTTYQIAPSYHTAKTTFKI